MNRQILENILDKVGFIEKFTEYIVNRKYQINYNDKDKIIDASNMFEVQYFWGREDKITEWQNILCNKNSNNSELFCCIIEIFDWGQVYKGNVDKAINLYKQNKLSEYIDRIRNLLDNSRIELVNDNEFEGLYWSSGWTKVYSYVNSDFVIYDSRVSAFLNYILKSIFENNIESLKLISNYLYNFKGRNNRARLVDDIYGFRKSNPSGVDAFNANLIASWIIKYIVKKLKLKNSSKDIERIFFMLGYDLKQIS